MEKPLYRIPHRLRKPLIISCTVLLIGTAVSCSTTEEIPVDMPSTAAYGLTPAEFDKLRFPSEDEPDVSITEEDNIPLSSDSSEVNEPDENPVSDSTYESHDTVPDANIDETQPLDDTLTITTDEDGNITISGNGNTLYTDNPEDAEFLDGTIALAGDGSPEDPSMADSAEPIDGNGSIRIKGEPSSDTALTDTMAEPINGGQGWIETVTENEPEPVDDTYGRELIEAIREYHDSVWAEKGESRAFIALMALLPYLLAILSAFAFGFIAWFMVKLSSGTFMTKKDRERLIREEKAEEERLQSSPVVNPMSGYNTLGMPPKGDDRIIINGRATVSKEKLIETDSIRFDELVDTEATPWPEETTRTELIQTAVGII